MAKILAACGNDCSCCPRHLPKTALELRNTAELWYKIGYRNEIVSNEEISCNGCTINNLCRYNIIQCVSQKGIDNCGECNKYPCDKILETFDVTLSFATQCKLYCSKEEFDLVHRAFFEKRKNLDEVHNKIKTEK